RILDSGLTRHPISRRRGISLVVLLAILVLPLSSMQLSHAAAQSGSITLSVALPAFSPKVEAVNEAIFKEFEDAHPGVQVKILHDMDLPNDPVAGVDAYFAAMQKYASSADVLFTWNTQGVVPHGTRAGYFLDLAPLVAADTAINVGDFYPAMWKAFQWDNGIWALPVTSELFMFSYHKPGFDKVGVPYPDKGWTLNDFADAVTKLSAKDSQGNVTTPGFAAYGIDQWALWQSLLDTKLYDDSSIPNAPQLASPSVEALLTTLHQLRANGIIKDSADENAPLGLNDPRHIARLTDQGAALLPGGKAELMTI